MRLKVKPTTLAKANTYVAEHHRHHKPVQGHRFSLVVVDEDNTIHGVVICGRPVARMIDPDEVLEVTRLCTDGTPNACSLLYAASARAAKAMGFSKIQTYILDSESGISLRAAGWTLDGLTKGRQWEHTDGKPRRTDQPTNDKQRWAVVFGGNR